MLFFSNVYCRTVCLYQKKNQSPQPLGCPFCSPGRGPAVPDRLPRLLVTIISGNNSNETFSKRWDDSGVTENKATLSAGALKDALQGQGLGCL